MQKELIRETQAQAQFPKWVIRAVSAMSASRLLYPETGHSSDGSARQKCAINTRHPYCDAQWRGTATIAKVATHTTRSPRMFMLTQAVSVFHKGQIRFNHFV